MATPIPVDYPAAHSMDTYWFAIDEAGEVAFMETGETCPVPTSSGSLAVDGLLTLLDHLDKDAQGIPILPVEQDLFPEGWTTAELESILASLLDEQRTAIQKLAFQTGLSAEEKRVLKESISHRFRDCVVLLADAADAKKFEKVSFIIRLDPLKPIFHIGDADVEILCLLVKGRLQAWRRADTGHGDWTGVSAIYGMYVFSESSASGSGYQEQLRASLFLPAEPTEYARTKIPQVPRIRLPETTMPAELTQRVAEKGKPASSPPVHFLPGIRFSETASLQVADIVPCYSWGEGDLAPDSINSMIRRNMARIQPMNAANSLQLVSEWRQAAEQGDLTAQYSLAYFYSQEPSTDHESAFYWYRKAADLTETIQSDSNDIFENGLVAQCCVADMYERGIGTPQNDSEAFFWYMKAATKGNEIAQYRLGMMYKSGRGVAGDRVQARVWLTKSAEQVYWPAKTVLQDFPDFEGAEQGDSQAQYELAKMYEEGRGVEKNKELALYWHTQSAVRGNAAAQYHLGKMCCDSTSPAFEPKQAWEWFGKAAAQGHGQAKQLCDARITAEQGDLRAIYRLAYLLQDTKLYTEAVAWYRKAADQAEASPVDSLDMFDNGSAAQCNLADKYEHGLGVPQDYEQALYWYRKSAAMNNRVAQYSLGMMYLIGRGVPMDTEQARAWLARSAAQGYEDAESELRKMDMRDGTTT